MGKYSGERSLPTAPVCAKAAISLRFDGKTLNAFGTRTPLVFPAVSGKPNARGQFGYSTERQRLRSQGPIPAGQYWVQPSQLWENNWVKNLVTAPRGAWGNFRLTIHPYPLTETHDRGGFFIHGGSSAGSAGCIDLTHYIDKFVERLTQELGGRPECYIPLTVQY